MNFCSHCGSDKLTLRVPSGDNRARHVCGQCGRIHYSNPKIVTGCLAYWEDQVLLCRRAIPPREGFWNVPGGYLENGETIEAGAVREVWEEARAEVRILGLHAIFSLPHVNQIYLHFLAELTAPRYEAGAESRSVGLFRESEIPWEEMAFHSSAFSLRHFFEDRKQHRREIHIGRMVVGEDGQRLSIKGLSTAPSK